MITLVYSNTEGWNLFEQFESEKKCDKWVKKNLDAGEEWYNPAPYKILKDHTILTYDGFHYD